MKRAPDFVPGFFTFLSWVQCCQIPVIKKNMLESKDENRCPSTEFGNYISLFRRCVTSFFVALYFTAEEIVATSFSFCHGFKTRTLIAVFIINYQRSDGDHHIPTIAD